METTKRFSDRVADYAKYRPRYPTEIVRILERETAIAPERTRVCDIGSGTGISALLFLREGYSVIGVEPNAPMREESQRLLAEYDKFTTVAGTAEETTLADASVDLIIAAQAFHWFDRNLAREECKRILSPSGIVALVWNDRREDTPFLRAYEDALVRHGTDYTQVKHQNIDKTVIAKFFGGPYVHRSVPNHQDFDREGLLGRARSSSYVPKEGPNHDAIMNTLSEIFEAYQESGWVRFAYDTKLWFGALR